MEMRQRKGRSMSEMLMILNLKRSLFRLYLDMSGFTTNTHTVKHHRGQHGAITNEDLTSL